MKQYISTGNRMELVTNESPTHYICGNNIYVKADVITDYHPLDNLGDKLHLVIVPFVNY